MSPPDCQHEWEPILRIDTDREHPNAIVVGMGVEQHLEGCPKCGAVRYWTVT